MTTFRRPFGPTQGLEEDRMRVLLIATNRHDRLMGRMDARPLPIGLAYVAGYLDPSRHTTKVLDLMFADDYLAEVEASGEGLQARPGGAVAAQPGQRQLPGPAMGLAGDPGGDGAGPVGERRGNSVRRAGVQHPARGMLWIRRAGPGHRRRRGRDICPAGGAAGGLRAVP